MNDTKKIQKELTDVVVPSCLLTKDPEKMTNAPMQYLISRKREEDRFLMLLCLFVFVPTASAAIYPDYWRNDTNFPLVWGHMGTAQYMDKTSLVVQRYDPPNYVIAVNVITQRAVKPRPLGLGI